MFDNCENAHPHKPKRHHQIVSFVQPKHTLLTTMNGKEKQRSFTCKELKPTFLTETITTLSKNSFQLPAYHGSTT